MKLTNSQLVDMSAGYAPDEYPTMELIETKITSTSRWSVFHDIVVKLDGQYWAGWFETPATEMQEVEGDNLIELAEVEAVEETVVKYKKKE